MDLINRRMPIWRSQDKIRTHWLTWLCLVDGLTALFTGFGRSNGPAQLLLKHMVPAWASAWSWPALLGAATVAIALGYYVEGAMAAAGVWVALLAAALVTIGTRIALSDAGWIWPAAMTYVHVLVIIEVQSGMDADRERRQRRR